MAEREEGGSAAVSGEDDAPNNPDEEDRESEFVEVDPSKRYGRYDEVLGKGAFKTVYRAFDEELGIEVAWNQVKVQDVLQKPEDLERLYSEVHLLKTLRHKNIIKFYNSWVDDKTKNVNFITEIFTSGTLRQYRKKHKHCDLKAVKNWSRQILRGLLYLHSHDPPIIHRDLKCDNIFVNGNQGEVKIGDLGLAAILRQAQAAHSVIGTPEFMAPELYEEEYNELVDIYSFGMCLLEMVTFEYPYSECINAAQIYKKVTTGKKPAALDKVKDPQVRAFVEKCLDPASRRLPARELLMDPFLNDGVESSDHQMPRTDSRPDEIEMLISVNDEPVPILLCLPDPRSQVPEPRALSGKVSSSRSDSLASAGKEDHSEGNHAGQIVRGDSFGGSGRVDSQTNGWNSLDEHPGGAENRKTDRVRSSRDFKVKGKRTDDDEKIYLRLRIADAKGHVRNIHFPFVIDVDTAASVASEMVAELDLSDEDVSNITEMIDAEITALVPEWHSVAMDDGSGGVGVEPDPESSLIANSDEEGGSAEQEDDGENLVTVSSSGSLLSPTPRGRGRSHSPSRSRSRSRSRPNSRGLLMSPSRVSLGASSPPKGYGVSHGRFWEGVNSEVLRFSSDESDDSDRRGISPVPEDDGEDESGSPHSSIRSLPEQAIVAYSGTEPPGISGELKKGDSAEVNDASSKKGLEGGWSDDVRTLTDPKRRSLTDFTELCRVQSKLSSHRQRSEFSSPPPPLAHSKSVEGFQLQGWGRHGSRGSADVEDEEDCDDEDSEIMEEEEKLRLEKEQAIFDLERYYDNRLIAVRNKHRKHQGELGSGHGAQKKDSARDQKKDKFSRNQDHHGSNGILNGYSSLDQSREWEKSHRKSPTPPPMYDEYSGSGRTTPTGWVENAEEEYGGRRRRESREPELSYGRRERDLVKADSTTELLYPVPRREYAVDPSILALGEAGLPREKGLQVGRDSRDSRDSREPGRERHPSRSEMGEKGRRESSKEKSQRRSTSPLPDSLRFSEVSLRREGQVESGTGRRSDPEPSRECSVRELSFRGYNDVGVHVPRTRSSLEITTSKYRESGLDEYHGTQKEVTDSHGRRQSGMEGVPLKRDVGRDSSDSFSSRREGEDRRDSGSPENGYSWRDREREHGRLRDMGRERELHVDKAQQREFRKERDRERAIERDRDRRKKDMER